MSRTTFDVREEYLGAGNLAAYTFDFSITDLSQLLVMVWDAAGVLLENVRGTDNTFISSVTLNADGTGTVNLLANLAAGHKMVLFLANDAPTQPSRFINRFDFTLSNIEKALDFLAGSIQRNSYLNSRSVKFSEYMSEADVAAFDASLPEDLVGNPGATIAVNMTGDGLMFGPTGDEINEAVVAAQAAQGYAEAAANSADASAQSAAASAANAGVPPGGAAGAALLKLSNADADTVWEPFIYDGISALTGGQFTQSGLKNVLDAIIRITYTPPQISLTAAGSGTIREKGAAVTSVALSANYVKKSNPIGAVRFKKDGTLINTVASPNPNGGTATYGWTGSFSDNASFSAEVDDTLVAGNGPTTVTSTQNFTYVYPYYYGAGAVGLTPAQVAALTKLIITSNATLVESMTATAGQVFYFAYPASYGALTSILDVNNFETIGDWTLSTSNITGLDGNAVSYRIYKFNNPVTAGTYQYTFKR